MAYVPPSLSGFNADAPPDDGSAVESNSLEWERDIVDKIGAPLQTFSEAINTAVKDRFDFTPDYSKTDAETTAGVTIVNGKKKPGNVLRYGENTTPGTTDMQPALHNAQLQMQEDTGANVFIPPGSYMSKSQWLITAPASRRSMVLAYGAEIRTEGAISAVAVTGGGTTGGLSIYGLQVNHRDNSDATWGFELYGTWNAHLIDCSV